MTRTQRRTLGISIVGVLAVTAYAALAAVQILVLNPLAAAPGLTLEEIRFEMSGAGESLMLGQVFLILGVGVVLAVVLSIVVVATGVHPLVAAMCFLALLMLGVIGYFAASFGAGMGLADTFGISGADYSPWARPLYAVSALSATALVAVGIVTAMRHHPAATTG
ncbi:hypothetical protein [Microbacterium sp. 2RAF4]|uniref:hypothetical protein n=1 Tax=Microbacterium sp. 2RAF4 TaxID=3232999 RepID=UPI003F9A67BB